jgi:hypothetical protein
MTMYDEPFIAARVETLTTEHPDADPALIDSEVRGAVARRKCQIADCAHPRHMTFLLARQCGHHDPLLPDSVIVCVHHADDFLRSPHRPVNRVCEPCGSNVPVSASVAPWVERALTRP